MGERIKLAPGRTARGPASSEPSPAEDLARYLAKHVKRIDAKDLRFVEQIQNGVHETVYPPEYVAKKPVYPFPGWTGGGK